MSHKYVAHTCGSILFQIIDAVFVDVVVVDAVVVVASRHNKNQLWFLC